MKKIRTPFALIVILTFAGCTKNYTTKPLCENIPLEFPSPLQTEDYLIWNLVLDSLYDSYVFMHLSQQTRIDTPYKELFIHDFIVNMGGQVDSSTVLDYINKNLNNTYIDPANIQASNMHLISSNEIDCLWDYNLWGSQWTSALNQKYPYFRKYPQSEGRLALYRPGFSLNGNEAILETSWYYSPDAAAGGLILLKKLNNQWKIIGIYGTWIV